MQTAMLHATYLQKKKQNQCCAGVFMRCQTLCVLFFSSARHNHDTSTNQERSARQCEVGGSRFACIEYNIVYASACLYCLRVGGNWQFMNAIWHPLPPRPNDARDGVLVLCALARFPYCRAECVLNARPPQCKYRTDNIHIVHVDLHVAAVDVRCAQVCATNTAATASIGLRALCIT